MGWHCESGLIAMNWTSAIRTTLRKLRRDERGMSAIELAFAVPIALGLTMNGVEITRYVLLHQKTERASMTVADLVSQGEVLTVDDLTNIFRAGAFITEPFDFTTNGAMLVTSVVGSPGGALVEWQRAFGQNPQSSSFGNQGSPAALPTGFVVADGESVVMAEIFYNYDPMFGSNPMLGGLVGSNTVYHYAVFRPRYTVKVRVAN